MSIYNIIINSRISKWKYFIVDYVKKPITRNLNALRVFCVVVVCVSFELNSYHDFWSRIVTKRQQNNNDVTYAIQ